MQIHWCLPVAFAGAIGCAGRVSVGDLGAGGDSPHGSAGTMGGLGMVPDGTYRAAGSTTGSATGPTASTSGSGGSAIGGAGGAAGGPGARPDAGIDGRANSDASVPIDVGNLGGAACGGIAYPPTGFYGDNILVPSYESVRIKQGESVEIAAKLPLDASLLIKLNWLDGPGGWSDEPSGDFFAKTTPGPVPPMFTQTFQAKVSGRVVEHGLRFAGSGRASVEYYECGSTIPTGTKMIDWDVAP